MKYQNQTINPETMQGEVDEVSVVSAMNYANLMPAVRTDTSSRALKTLASEQEFNLSVERNRAELTFSLLNLTAQLTSVEQALAENCPAAEPRLRALVDAYTFAGAAKIARY